MLSRKVVRFFLDGARAILSVMGLSMNSGNGWFLSLERLTLFLGVTGIGRQCPLILSARHLDYRIRWKRKPPFVSTKPIEKIGGGDRRNVIS